jgi:flagellar L-ring protein precursor FlgH
MPRRIFRFSQQLSPLTLSLSKGERLHNGIACRSPFDRLRVSGLMVGLALALAGCRADPPPPFLPTPYAPPLAPPTSGAIFRPDSYAALTEDRRARRVGDLVTVQLVERTQATKSATLDTARTSSSSVTLPSAKPFSLVPDGLLSGGADSAQKGSGSAAQSNQLTGELTVTVVEILPGGALRVAGRKALELNRGDEYLTLTGVVRPEDLSPDNRVASTRLAEARVSYTGKGDLAAQSRTGWFARVLAALSPF